MAAREDPAAKPARGSSTALLWAEGLLCGALMSLLPTVALLLGALLGPAVVALALDHQPGKPVARCVVLCSLAASIAPVRALWGAGYGWAASLALATDLNVLGTAWSAAAAGWLLAELVPFAVRAGLETASAARAAQLRAERAALIAEWGLEPGSMDHPPVSVAPPAR